MIKSVYKRLLINRSAIWKLACTITGSIFTLWGFISLFNPLENIFQNDTTLLCKLLIGLLVLLVVFIVSYIIAAFIVLYSNQICIGESLSKKKVYVKYGDMYSPQIVECDENYKRAIVIPVNRCFDTIVDNHLISLATQHGKVFRKLYDNHIYT